MPCNLEPPQQPENDQEDDSTQCGNQNRNQIYSGHTPNMQELCRNPTPQERPQDTYDDVPDDAKSAASNDQARQEPSDQPNHNPR
jgi:hypothetical protein